MDHPVLGKRGGEKIIYVASRQGLLILDCTMLCYVIYLFDELAQIRGSISNMKMDIQKKKSTSINDKMGIKSGFCAYMCMYRQTGKLIET